MHTLLLRLIGPMQSWGTNSRYSTRDTGQEPSKSGVIGLICAALGRHREAMVDDLSALRFGVRVDQPGIVERDFHTARNIAKIGGGLKDTELTTRFYLADASFLVGLEGADPNWLERIEAAMRAPAWQLSLGRKSYVPSLPIALPWRDGSTGGLRRGIDLESALMAEPFVNHAGERVTPPAGAIRLVVEVTGIGRNERRFDEPAPSLPLSARRFYPRYVETTFMNGVDAGNGAHGG